MSAAQMPLMRVMPPLVSAASSGRARAVAVGRDVRGQRFGVGVQAAEGKVEVVVAVLVQHRGGADVFAAAVMALEDELLRVVIEIGVLQLLPTQMPVKAVAAEVAEGTTAGEVQSVAINTRDRLFRADEGVVDFARNQRKENGQQHGDRQR